MDRASKRTVYLVMFRVGGVAFPHCIFDTEAMALDFASDRQRVQDEGVLGDAGYCEVTAMTLYYEHVRPMGVI